jgi:glycosyltransferase involved in cell wall biosynthesis
VTENLPLAHDHRAKKQVKSLLAAGWHVSVVGRRHDDNGIFREMPGLDLFEYPAPPEPSSKIGYLWEYGYSLVAATIAICRARMRGRFDVVQTAAPPDAWFLLALPFKWAGRPYIVDQRDLSPELYASRYGIHGGIPFRLLRGLERASWRTADRIFAISERHRSVMRERGGVAPEAITIVGNGPSLASAVRRPPDPALRNGRRHLACWIGTMGVQDSIDVALQAAHHLIRVLGRTDCHFVFIGDGEVLPELCRLTAELDIEAWVSFTGWLPQEEAFTYLSTADVGLEPIVQEDIATVKCLEYMAFGIPFVGSDLPEISGPAGDAAVYVVPGDVEAFALEIDALLDDPDRRAEMGAIARRRVKELHAWERQEEHLLDAYASLASRDGLTVAGEAAS